MLRLITSGNESNRIYGFHFRGSYSVPQMQDIVQYYTSSLGLPVMDEEYGEMKVNTPEWKQALEPILQLYDEHVFPNISGLDTANPYGPIGNNPFLTGKLAMSVVSFSELMSVVSIHEQAHFIKGFEPIDFDVVTIPQQSGHENARTDMRPDQVFAIHANSKNMEDAWSYIEFI